MKGIFAGMALLLAAVLLAGCANAPAAQSFSVSQSAPRDDAPQAKAGLKAALVLETGIFDAGWNNDCYEGMRQAQDILGFSIAVQENVPQEEMVSVFRRFGQEGYDLIVAPGWQYQEAVEEVFSVYPGSHFAGINFTFTAQNVTSLNFNNVQAGFLAGALAGMLTASNSVGFVGGAMMKPTIEVMRGMGQGLRHVNPEAQFTSAAVGGWNSPEKCRETAETQIHSQGVDVIFSYADAGNAGVLEAAGGRVKCLLMESAEMFERSPGGAYGSIRLSNSAMILLAAHLVVGGENGQALVGDIANGVVGPGSYHEEVPEEVAQKMDEICQDIIAGNIVLEA